VDRAIIGSIADADRIYHLALREEWEDASGRGVYRQSTLGRSLEDEGFIHCSFPTQVQLIADLVYRERDDVVLLEIDPSGVSAEIRVEAVGDHRFPHIYGGLPVEAVVRVSEVPLGNDGQLLVEPLLD